MPMTLQQQKQSVKLSSFLDVLAGVWLVIAPFVLGYTFLGTATLNAIIIGAAIIVFAGVRAGSSEGYTHAWPSWINFALGIWLLIAPFALGYAAIAAPFWNDIVVGVIVMILSATSAISTPENV